MGQNLNPFGARIRFVGFGGEGGIRTRVEAFGP